LDDRTLGASPLWKGGDITSEGGIVYLVDEYTKEGSSLVVGIRLQLRADIDYECGGDGRKQTGLTSTLVSMCLSKPLRNIQRLRLCSGLRRASSGIPCHIHRQPYGSLHKNGLGDLLAWVVFSAPGCVGASTTIILV
jgi:hypothetical protein